MVCIGIRTLWRWACTGDVSQKTSASQARDQGLQYSQHSRLLVYVYSFHPCVFQVGNVVSLSWMSHLQWVFVIAKDLQAYETSNILREPMASLPKLCLIGRGCFSYPGGNKSSLFWRGTLFFQGCLLYKAPRENGLEMNHIRKDMEVSWRVVHSVTVNQ